MCLLDAMLATAVTAEIATTWEWHKISFRASAGPPPVLGRAGNTWTWKLTKGCIDVFSARAPIFHNFHSNSFVSKGLMDACRKFSRFMSSQGIADLCASFFGPRKSKLSITHCNDNVWQAARAASRHGLAHTHSWAAVFRQHPKEQRHRYVAHLTLHSMSVPGGPLLERLTRLSPCAPSHAKPWNCPQAYPLGEAISKPWQQRAKWCSPLLSTGSAVAWAPSLLAFECHDPCWWATMYQHPLAAPSKLGSTSKWRWAKSQHHPPRLAVACRSSHIASMPSGVKHNIHVHLGTSESSCLGTSGTSGLNVLCSRSWPRPCKGSWWPCHPQQWGAAISAKEHFWPGCVARLLNDLDGYPDWWPRHKGHAVLGTAGFYLLQLFQLLAWLKSSESSWLSCSSSSLTKTFASSPSWPCSADFCSLLTYLALEFLGFDAKAANSRTQQETWNESRTLMVSPKMHQEPRKQRSETKKWWDKR